MITNINTLGTNNTNTIIVPQEQPISRIITRENTFSNLGVDVKNAKSVEEALQISNLDYTVSLQDSFIFSNGDAIRLPKKEIIRDTDYHYYQTVSESYKIKQNYEIFDEILTPIFNEIKIEKMGETINGMIYAIASLEPLQILNDVYKPYLCIRTSHNSKYSLTAAICPLRIVCQNQFNIAFKEAQNIITARHTENSIATFDKNVDLLLSTTDYMKELNKQAEFWATQKVSNQQIVQIIDELFPLQQDMKDFQIQRVEDNKAQFIKAYKADDNGNFRNSMWGLINAYSDYITHREPARKTATSKENQFVAVTFDPTLMSHFIQLVSRIAA